MLYSILCYRCFIARFVYHNCLDFLFLIKAIHFSYYFILCIIKRNVIFVASAFKLLDFISFFLFFIIRLFYWYDIHINELNINNKSVSFHSSWPMSQWNTLCGTQDFILIFHIVFHVQVTIYNKNWIQNVI